MQETDLTTMTKQRIESVSRHGVLVLPGQRDKRRTRFTPRTPPESRSTRDQRQQFRWVRPAGRSRGTARSSSRTYEGVRQPNEVTLSQTVPPDAWRDGDLSSVASTIRNPVTGQPFAGNRIPVNPVSGRLLESFYERQNQATGAAIDARTSS